MSVSDVAGPLFVYGLIRAMNYRNGKRYRWFDALIDVVGVSLVLAVCYFVRAR